MCMMLCCAASQNMYLLTLLPFAMKDFFDCLEDNVYWNLILTLRNICNILLAFEVSIEQLGLLRTLIFEYLEERKNRFPEVSLKPKHHFLSHYPYFIKQFGPIRHL